MATRTITQLVSDLTGDKIDDDNGETVAFSYRGTSYTIDLTGKEAAGFDKSIAMYLEHATKVGGRRKTTRTAAAGDKDYSAREVRTWARDKGITVPDRGRIPVDVLEQYRAEN